MKKIIKTFLFCVIFVGIWALFAQIVKPKRISFTTNENYNIGRQFTNFYNLKKNSLEYILIGASNSMPVMVDEVYDKYSIKGYNLSTPSQRMQGIYYILEEAFRFQKPKIVLLDVAKIFDGDAYNRYAFDYFKFGIPKVKYAKYIVKKFHNKENYASLFSLLYKYHERWSELKKEDIAALFINQHYFLNGPNYPNNIVKIDLTLNEMNKKDEQYRNEGYIEINIKNNIIEKKYNQYPPFKEIIRNSTIDSIININNLCKLNGAKLVLIKVPNIGYPEERVTKWTEYRRNMVKNIAKKLKIDYVDFMYDWPLDIDLNKDSRDGGAHLNFGGGAKMGQKLGEYLNSLKILEKNQDDVWDDDIIKYRKLKKVVLLQMENNFEEYIKKLDIDFSNSLVLVSAIGNFRDGLDDSERVRMKEFGMNVDTINNYKSLTSYNFVKCNKKIDYEMLSNRKIEFSGKAEEIKYQLQTSPIETLITAGLGRKKKSSIVINGKEYSNGLEGISIVVVDLESGLVLDSVNFETAINKTYRKASRTNVNYYSYEYFLIEGKKP